MEAQHSTGGGCMGMLTCSHTVPRYGSGGEAMMVLMDKPNSPGRESVCVRRMAQKAWNSVSAAKRSGLVQERADARWTSWLSFVRTRLV